jgi:CheY-like chemotaxis protein/AraC-like DNA-binding protein
MAEDAVKPIKYHVLTAEENAVEQKLLAAALGTIHCEASFVSSGRELIQSATRSDFDLIILPSWLPDMPASAIIEAIRSSSGWKSRIPVVLIYPNGSRPIESLAEAAGADACFNKPLPVLHFLAVVRAHAEAGRQLRLQSLAGWGMLEYPIRGIEDLRSPAMGASFDATQLRPGLGQGRFTHAILGNGVFSFGNFRTAGTLRLRGELAANAVYIATGLGIDRPDSFWGRDLAFGDMGAIIAAAKGQEFDSIHSPGMVGYAAIAVPEQFFYEFVQRVAPKFRPIERPIVRQPPIERRFRATRAFYHAIGAIRNANQGNAPGFDPGRLMLRVLNTFVMALGAEEEPAPPMSQDRRIIARVEELAQSNTLASSVPGICLQLGESRATLEAALRRELDTSPAHYLKVFQLCRVREELAHGNGSVAAVAAKHGFPRVGQFARRYKYIFGEFPSETLAFGKGLRVARGGRGATQATVDLLRRVLR